jgi:hypothetical protein
VVTVVPLPKPATATATTTATRVSGSPPGVEEIGRGSGHVKGVSMSEDRMMRASDWVGTLAEGRVRHEVHLLGSGEWRVVARLRTSGGDHLLSGRVYATQEDAEAEYASRTAAGAGPNPRSTVRGLVRAVLDTAKEEVTAMRNRTK